MNNKYIYLKESDEVAGPLQREAPVRPHIVINPETFNYYIKARREWENYIATLPRKKTDGTHSWSDQQVLEENVDFKFGSWQPESEEEYQEALYEAKHELPSTPPKVVIPIKSDSKEDKPDRSHYMRIELSKMFPTATDAQINNMVELCLQKMKPEAIQSDSKVIEGKDENYTNWSAVDWINFISWYTGMKERTIQQGLKQYFDKDR